MRLRFLLCLLLVPLLASGQIVEPATVRIGVLSLFHPGILLLASPQTITLVLDSGTLTLPRGSSATLARTADGISVAFHDAPAQLTHSLSTSDSSITLTVPGKLTRTYSGSLFLTASDKELIPVIVMPTEVAVASIVQAESHPHAGFEALQAQAVVSRSYLLALPAAHANFDSCDTTHCQFLRSPPSPSSAAALATQATTGIVITWRPSPEASPTIVRAMYSRSCGGYTRPLHANPDSYPFYRVACSFCLRHPELWQRRISPSDTPRDEHQRILFNRTHGWSALPSISFSSNAEELTGRGAGHGVGLCQLGANDMAARGAKYRDIVAHFFPDTTLIRLKQGSLLRPLPPPPFAFAPSGPAASH